MEAKHTPGPWAWVDGEDGLMGAGGEMVLNSAPYEGMWLANNPRGRKTANASLIAAAPDLLEALLDCRRALELANFTGELAVVDAAIAKALPLNV